MLLWMASSGTPKALQASECSELLAIARGVDLLLELPHLAAQPGNLAIQEVDRARGLLQAGLEVLNEFTIPEMAG